MVDRLENYIPGHGNPREESDSGKPGSGPTGCRGLKCAVVNAFKDRVLAPLFAMQERFRQADLTAGMTEAVLTLLADCRAEETAGKLSGVFYKNRGTPTGGEYGQVYGLVTELLKAPVRSSGRGAREPERVSGNSGCRLCGAGGCYSRQWQTGLVVGTLQNTSGSYPVLFFCRRQRWNRTGKKRAGKPAFRP